MEKITDEELQALKDIVAKVNQVHIDIASFEMRKLEAVETAKELIAELQSQQTSLGEKYGVNEIDLNTGEIKEA